MWSSYDTDAMNAQMNWKHLKEALRKAGRGLWRATPALLGVVLLVSIATVLIPTSVYATVFQGTFLDPLIGSFLGSVLAGNPVTSYVIGGELLGQGVSLLAVTAFLVAWVTVGVVQFPAESMILGRRFALVRNISAFVLAVLVAIITVLVVGV